MTQTALLERLRAQETAVKILAALGAGTVTRWHVRPGQHVTRGMPLAVFVSAKSIDEITAPTTGKVTVLLVQAGTRVEPDEVVAYITPDHPPSSRQEEGEAASNGTVKAPQSPQKRLTKAMATKTEAEASKGPEQRLNTAHDGIGRHSTMLELDLLPSPTELVKPRRRTRKKRPRIVKLTTHPTDEQLNQLRALMERLADHGHDYAFSEIQRLAFDLVLSLSERELVAYAERQRDQEEAERYGFGNRPCAL